MNFHKQCPFEAWRKETKGSDLHIGNLLSLRKATANSGFIVTFCHSGLNNRLTCFLPTNGTGALSRESCDHVSPPIYYSPVFSRMFYFVLISIIFAIVQSRADDIYGCATHLTCKECIAQYVIDTLL